MAAAFTVFGCGGGGERVGGVGFWRRSCGLVSLPGCAGRRCLCPRLSWLEWGFVASTAVRQCGGGLLVAVGQARYVAVDGWGVGFVLCASVERGVATLHDSGGCGFGSIGDEVGVVCAWYCIYCNYDHNSYRYY